MALPPNRRTASTVWISTVRSQRRQETRSTWRWISDRGKFLEPKDGLLGKWQIDEVPNQYRFYDRHVRPWIEEADSRRAFVIISDAFRYEAAQELTAELNGKYRFGAVLSSQLGVLPL